MSQILQTPPTQRTTFDVVKTGLRPQWVRYLVAGVGAAAVDLSVFHLLATVVLPCVGEVMSETVRSQRFMIDKTFAFLIANVSSYTMNSRWVFEQGRHRESTEVTLFVSMSVLSYLGGMQLGRFLIEFFAAPSHLAAVACIGLATIMNYVIRKTVVFRR